MHEAPDWRAFNRANWDLTLAQCGAAVVVGLDFSGAAIAAARKLSIELGRAHRLNTALRFSGKISPNVA